MRCSRRAVSRSDPARRGCAAASLPPRSCETVRGLDGFIAENAKSARQFLKAVEYPVPLRKLPIVELNEHTPAAALPALLAPVRDGQRIGLLSEAGCPAVADPGAALVALAHREGLRVVPLVGPSSLLLALMASGLNGQRFCFHGYLPTERDCLRRCAQDARGGIGCERQRASSSSRRRTGTTTAGALLERVPRRHALCLATELTLPGEQIAHQAIAHGAARRDIERRPTVFLLQARPRARADSGRCADRYRPGCAGELRARLAQLRGRPL